MNPVVRALSIYLFLLLVFRIIGKRSLSESTTFDFVLLLVIGEVTQQALVGADYSLTAAFVLIISLVTIDLLFGLLKDRFPFFGKIAESVPLIIVDHGKPLRIRMHKLKVSEEDVLEAGRLHVGIERMEEIKYAVLEKDGSISIVPAKNTGKEK